MYIARIFSADGSQAVWLPKGFRFDADEVYIRRYGSGVILEPLANDWGWLDSVIGPIDEDFESAALDRTT